MTATHCNTDSRVTRQDYPSPSPSSASPSIPESGLCLCAAAAAQIQMDYCKPIEVSLTVKNPRAAMKQRGIWPAGRAAFNRPVRPCGRPHAASPAGDMCATIQRAEGPHCRTLPLIPKPRTWLEILYSSVTALRFISNLGYTGMRKCVGSQPASPAAAAGGSSSAVGESGSASAFGACGGFSSPFPLPSMLTPAVLRRRKRVSLVHQKQPR
ncbi:hypothetical protein EYF80_040118 [Liparis tanakae]|uniref:Uncharacterized protein n=1 Tax=Liparis tanakae TaxID=230148 RepID=A0A4Z2G7Z7_9TELE|nr:hypothetical protein EYF80_040118 [Liparis tanakae]